MYVLILVVWFHNYSGKDFTFHDNKIFQNVFIVETELYLIPTMLSTNLPICFSLIIINKYNQ